MSSVFPDKLGVAVCRHEFLVANLESTHALQKGTVGHGFRLLKFFLVIDLQSAANRHGLDSAVHDLCAVSKADVFDDVPFSFCEG